jgi:hypothetical protein
VEIGIIFEEPLEGQQQSSQSPGKRSLLIKSWAKPIKKGEKVPELGRGQGVQALRAARSRRVRMSLNKSENDRFGRLGWNARLFSKPHATAVYTYRPGNPYI